MCKSDEEGIELQNFIQTFPFSGGLAPGDIVTNINKAPVKTSKDIYDALTRPGEPIEMNVFRGLEKLKVVIYPEDPE